MREDDLQHLKDLQLQVEEQKCQDTKAERKADRKSDKKLSIAEEKFAEEHADICRLQANIEGLRGTMRLHSTDDSVFKIKKRQAFREDLERQEKQLLKMKMALDVRREMHSLQLSVDAGYDLGHQSEDEAMLRLLQKKLDFLVDSAREGLCTEPSKIAFDLRKEIYSIQSRARRDGAFHPGDELKIQALESKLSFVLSCACQEKHTDALKLGLELVEQDHHYLELERVRCDALTACDDEDGVVHDVEEDVSGCDKDDILDILHDIRRLDKEQEQSSAEERKNRLRERQLRVRY